MLIGCRMSHFYLENEIGNLVRMDAPITKGPLPRWQRKALEVSNISITGANVSSSKVNTSLNTSNTKIHTSAAAGGNVSSFSKTPSKRSNPDGSITAGKSPSKSQKKSPGRNKSLNVSGTPGRGSKTPNGGDRFIPHRGATQFEMGHYKLTQEESIAADNNPQSPSKQEYQRIMSEKLNGGDINSARIISYQKKAPAAPEGHQNSLKVLYSQSKTPGAVKKTTRHIPHVPERILDAPEIMDDYYLNLLDWSVKNHLAVALGSHIYLWNGETGDITQLLEMEEPEEYVSSVAWITEGNFLALGSSNGTVQIWDIERMKRTRMMSGHSARVGALAWNSYILSSGSRSGNIHHHDVRIAQHHVSTLSGHTQEVCGLKWSPDGKYLASGGNDNLLNIWPVVTDQCYTETTPLYSFSQHQAAVKAVAWCPWQPHILASGGGTADRCIRFWNCNIGICLNTIDTKSQVCAIVWSSEYKELMSSHGYANNQLIIWKYPSMIKVAELTGHTARVLHLAMSPDGSTVVSGAADETLRLWKCFASDPQKKKDSKSASNVPSILQQGIR